eukprot:TRINITY_DN8612_c0_g1_i1.p1 TRINITY_DN8612_c0_g1~~TRINITY_DN8612_c0_g1_i1.p1  ORF type:complete len:414 (-),score=74.09 TRINITY_DN8612_c0_g1_i1:46-1203(-)
MIIGISVHRANNLPKADILGTIDPYIIIKEAETKTQIGKTNWIKNNYNPKWNEHFGFETTSSPLRLLFEVWDADLVKDDFVATLGIDVSISELPIEKKTYNLMLQPKYTSENPSIQISIGVMLNYQSLKAFDDRRVLLTPVPNFSKDLLLSIQYINYRLVIKLLETTPDFEEGKKLCELLFRDAVSKCKVSRKTYDIESPKSLQGTELKIFAQNKIKNITATTPLNHLYIRSSKFKVLQRVTAGDLVTSYGWLGDLTYQKAKIQLDTKRIQFDDSRKCIFMMDQNTCFIVDWDKGDIDLSFGLFEKAALNGISIDMVYGKNCGRTMVYYAHPKKLDDNSKMLLRCAVDDIKDKALAFSNVFLFIYEKEAEQSIPFVEIVPIFNIK